MKLTENDVLIVVDVQNDFCKGGALAVPGADENFVEHINRIIGKFTEAGAAVVFTQDFHTQEQISFASNHPGKQPFETVQVSYGTQVLWPDHCIQGTYGAEFHTFLASEAAHIIIRKGFRDHVDSYSAFFENDRKTPTGLKGYLSDRDIYRVFIVGLAYDFCVGYTARDAANDMNIDNICVIEDGCRAIDLEGSLASMNSDFDLFGVERINSTDIR